VQYRVTLVEGWTFQQALEEIWNREKISLELKDKNPLEISRLLGIDQETPEGMLFPDTYFYTKGESDLDLLLRANRRLNEVLNQSWESRLGALPFESSYEALILASIVEKESANNSERGHVAGVFVRRLETGMRLQSDPTVIYGMGDRYQGNIARTDLQEQTDYNTYRISGLPPSPIALAGLESINATLNPLESDYLYFVSRGDGSHQFSSNLEQHNQAVQEFQRQAENVVQ
ncbi:MAG: endolytic transglycosylase MltG, partial [Gammaproteobacteria bacterium]|nr:endolytic transglycosylase MltG [Gammaproteobacteria bacterium]